ncbi:ArsR/SmtB family transcription factor [Rathayibacter soli]|uniref:ArsR/SmtB family transcription factor n=1 Tax=Rathayibacter soli TaxID=3144168 RepID=UPI0039080E5F
MRSPRSVAAVTDQYSREPKGLPVLGPHGPAIVSQNVISAISRIGPSCHHRLRSAGRKPTRCSLACRRLTNLVNRRDCAPIWGLHWSTAELAQSWEVSAPEVSRHLAVLREAGLATSSREGRFVLYRADAVAIQRLGSDLLSGLLR